MHESDLETILKQHKSRASDQRNQKFRRQHDTYEHGHTRTLANNNFFTAHALPTKRVNTGNVTREYAFLLPSGTCIIQPYPTTRIDPNYNEKEWAKYTRQYEHNGWQVKGMSGQFLVFERLRSPKQQGLIRAKQFAGRFTLAVAGLTGLIFAGKAVYGV